MVVLHYRNKYTNTGSANLKFNHEQAKITCYMQSLAGSASSGIQNKLK